jgi:hypothetical protein
VAVSIIPVLIIIEIFPREVTDYMKDSKKLHIVVLLITSLMLITYGTSVASATDSSLTALSPGMSAQWSVTNSSGVTATWYSETFMPRGDFSLPVGSTINFTMTSVFGGRFRGNISVGGLDLANVSMTEISFNLLLGWYPFQPGLVCPTNWDVQVRNATSNGFKVQIPLSITKNIIIFDHLNGTVGTRLTYDKKTGLLLDGYGSFGQFTIEVVLVPAPLTSSEATMVIVLAAVAVALVIFGGWYGASRKLPRH